MPLLAWVVDEFMVYAPISQPMTQEMFPDLNPWAPAPASGRRNMETWDSQRGSWVPLPASGVLSIPLPYTEVPLVRFSTMSRLRPDPREASKGQGLRPMPSIKGQLYDVPFIWPQQLRVPRNRLNASWCVTLAGPVPAIESRWVDGPGAGHLIWEDGSENDVALGLHAL